METVTLIGITGAGIILVAFLFNQAGKMTAESKWYDAINAVGSFMLVVYAVLLNSAPFVILNVVWLLVSVYGVFKHK